MSTDNCAQIYAIHRWGGGYFDISDAGHLCVRPDPSRTQRVDLVELAQELENSGLSLPVLVRFNDILRDRVRALRDAFDRAREAQQYSGVYTPVYPIKVNQQRSVLEQIVAGGTGLEAGSKPELMVALAFSRPGGVIICNGYKDREYVRLAMIGRRIGFKIYIVIEKLTELNLVLEEAQRIGAEPLLGVRVRLASAASGKWQDSGGEKAKFGLAASQVLTLVERLDAAGRLDCLQLLHAHFGSQIPNLRDIRKGLREVTRYFVELRRLNAPLSLIDVGGGLGVDYEGTRSRHYCSTNYGIDDYANEIVGALARVCAEHELPEPNIISESGRALTAHHALLITNVIERETVDGHRLELEPDERSGSAIGWLAELLDSAEEASPLETFEEAREALAEARAQFESGVLDLRGRARAEILFFAICRALQPRLKVESRRQREALDRINLALADKLYLNFSIFQSMPDVWAIDQIFPVAPLQRLDEPPERRGIVHDLTCDSDGCIDHYVDQDGVEASLPIHATVPGERYLIGMFLVGAYQEILGDMHNLFGDTDAVNIELNDDGYELLEPERGDSVDELLSYVHYDPKSMLAGLWRRLFNAGLDRETREYFYLELQAGLHGYTYLED